MTTHRLGEIYLDHGMNLVGSVQVLVVLELL